MSDAVAACLARIAAGNGALRGMIAVDAAARGGAGVVVAVKDVFDVAGMVTTANARLFAGARPAARDSAVVARLRAAGAVIIGKANCWEMSVGGPSWESPAPPAVNPWAVGGDPGGSSSGSAVAVASGMAMVGIGGDTGGSVRLPASFCGVVGFKPTFGAVPMEGAVPFAETLDVAGPMARSAAECAAVQAVLSGGAVHGAVGLGGLRVGVPEGLVRLGGASDAVMAGFEGVCSALARAGAVVTRVELPSAGVFNQCYFLVARGEAFARWGETLAARPEAFNALTRRSFAIGAMIPAEAVADAARLRVRLRAELAEAMAGVDVLALPTTPDEAPDLPVGDLDVEDAFSRPDTAPFTRPFSLVGVPAVSLPCGLGARGRPLGLQLVGRHGADGWLLAVASAVEQVLPGIGTPREWWA